MNTTDTLKVTTPTPTEIVMTRAFNATRQRVFDAFTKPEFLRHWLGRAGDVMTICEVDPRVGGAYRYEFELRADNDDENGDADTDNTFREIGTFREIESPERIVCVESFGDYGGEAKVATSFVEQDGQTTMTTTTTYPSQRVRDAVLASGVASGAGESYMRLDELLRSAQWRTNSRTL